MKRVCSKCDKPVIWIKTEKQNKDRSYVYVDGEGRWWKCSVCPLCLQDKRRDYVREYNYARSRRLGNSTRRTSPDERIQKSLKYEDWAKDFILANGISINDKKIHATNLRFIHQSLANGPDLIFENTRTKRQITIEVKPVTNRAARGICYIVDAVKPNRLTDDIIAMVYSPSLIVFDRMKSHLAECSPCGNRTVSSIFKPRIA